MEYMPQIAIILNRFRCSSCLAIPSPPIYNCVKGNHFSLCGICVHERGVELGACGVCLEPSVQRDFFHERVITGFHFPCDFRDCTGNGVDGEDRQRHLLQCDFREINCLFQGCYSLMEFHLYSQHLREGHMIEDCKEQVGGRGGLFYVGHGFWTLGIDRECSWKGMLIKFNGQEFYTRSFLHQKNLYFFLLIFGGSVASSQYQVQMKLQGVQGEEQDSPLLTLPVFQVRTPKRKLIENYPEHYRLDVGQLRKIIMKENTENQNESDKIPRLDFRIQYRILEVVRL